MKTVFFSSRNTLYFSPPLKAGYSTGCNDDAWGRYSCFSSNLRRKALRFLLLLLLCFVLFLTWSLTSLELVRHTRLASNSYTLCLPRSRTKGMSHHAQPYLFLTEMGCHFIEFSMLVCWFLPKGDVTITYSEPEHFPLSHPTHISVKPVLMALWLWKCCLWLSHSVCYD